MGRYGNGAGSSLTFLVVWIIIGNAIATTGHNHDIDPTLSGFSNVKRVTGRVLREIVEERPIRTDRQRRVRRHVPVSTTVHPEDGGHIHRLKLELPLDSTNHVLDLYLNRDLITDSYFERYQQESTEVVQKPSYEETELCHYRGKIHDRPTSWAAVATCDGIRGVVFDGTEMHYLEPMMPPKSNKNVTELKGNSVEEGVKWKMLHYKGTDYKRNHSCGHDEHKDIMPGFLGAFLGNDSSPVAPILQRRKRGLADHDDTRVSYNSNAKSRYVELVMVVDNKKYKDLGGDFKQAVRRSKDVANIVNALYQPFNIFIALVGVVVWTEMDEITISTNGDDTLSSFLLYRRERLLKQHPNDNAQLLTAVEFDKGVVGKAMQGPICSYKYSGGVNSDFRNNLVGIVATTVAHELGHNFGLSHDDQDKCQCSSPGNRCIMAASAGSNRTSRWSSCSLEDMAYAFDHGMDYCLRNKPKSLYEGPTCGNGFTEPGEECDCGLPEHCDNDCCDAANCLMHDNATCASGTCCDILTCHVKAGGTPCRETTGLCGLPEYCTGESEFCPEDVHKLDGVKCDTPTGQAYCSNGECATHTDQCKLLWGPSGNNSDELCYQRNTNGSKVAHCGYNLATEQYSQCKSEDAKCGVLQCQMNSEKLEYGYESAAILANFFVNAGGKIYPCRSVIVDFGLQDISPGMVPDGAQCGDDKMCVNQKCVAVSSVLGSLADGCGDCSGHGVCNSKGHCHCDDGYGGNVCEGSGYGGSVDSGPPFHRGTSRFAKAVYITFFGFIPLISIITFYLYYANDSLKKLCLEIRRNGLSAVANPQITRGPKPSSNGHLGSSTTSPQSPPPNQTQHQPPGQGSSPTSPQSDFFGNYKGFSLSPIKSPKPGSRPGSSSTPNRGASTNNNNNSSALPNGHVQNSVNATNDVYYSPVPRVESELLVKNSSEKPTLKSPHSNFLNNKGSTRVSWAQPIASRLPVSPPSDEESANSDTPLYEQSSQNSSPIMHQHKLPGECHSQSNPRRPPHPDASPENKDANPKEPRKGLKKEPSFSGMSNSALSRIAAALPFMRNPLRSSLSQEDNHRLSKNFPKSINRENLEISKPILQSQFDQQKIHCVPITPSEEQEPRYANVPTESKEDQVDGAYRYANIQSQSQPKPALKNLQRVKDTTPPPQQTSKPIPKVQRAHSMIQPNVSNRNSLNGGNPNYNSLRRSRPTAPPPKPPEAPPPPPPNNLSNLSTTGPSSIRTFFKSSTPPPYNPATTSGGSPNSVRASILKFSFGRTAVGGTDWLRSKLNNTSLGHLSTHSVKAPEIPKHQHLDLPSPTPELPPSPPPIQNKEDNIYDTIDEGIPPHFDNFEKKAELASSEESSPKRSPEVQNLEDKIETLSTGSSENGGLLNEIISEIKCRNRESIYNSVDRRKQKAKKKAAAAAAAAAANNSTSTTIGSGFRSKSNSRENSPSSRDIGPSQDKGKRISPSPTPYISPKPPSSTSSTLSSSGSSFTNTRNFRTPQPTTFTMSSPRNSPPLRPESPQLYQKPKPIEKPITTLQPQVNRHSTSTLPSNSTLAPTPPPYSYSLTSQSSFSTPRTHNLSSSSISSPKSNGINITPNPSHNPPSIPNSIAKPTCAVNGIPKTITSSPTPSTSSTMAVTSSPSYVAKINYFSNLTTGSGGTPVAMKPISSLPAPSTTNPAKEIIYAPSNVGINSENERGHLSTIRRSRASYNSNKDSLALNEDERNRNENNKDTQQAFVRKPSGIYGSLGRKVAAPVIRSNSLEKEKIENKLKAENTKLELETIRKTEDLQEGQKQPLVGGYKPFNPYLNRPLTFSTFRPNSNANGPSTSSANSNSNPTVTNGVNASAKGIVTNGQKPITLNTYSISNNKTALLGVKHS